MRIKKLDRSNISWNLLDSILIKKKSIYHVWDSVIYESILINIQNAIINEKMEKFIFNGIQNIMKSTISCIIYRKLHWVIVGKWM